MTLHTPLRRAAAIGLIASLALLLAGCLLTPGKFNASLDLRKDGHFSYRYSGQMVMLNLTKLGQLGDMAGDSKFEPSACTKDDSTDERPCTKAELDKQKADWDAAQAAAAAKKKKDGEEMSAMLGGYDPTNPKTAQEFADRLSHQAGWKSVVYKGDGIYEVEFAISGRLDHDFSFPMIERFPLANVFVAVTRRSDGTVRFDAPAFTPAASGGPVANFAQMAAMSGKKEAAMKELPQLDGHFTLTTDGAILANNTDEGPKPIKDGQQLDWAISPRTTSAPTALVRLGG